jgi:hypothetical protein
MGEISKQLPQYQCHKKVWALQIHHIDGLTLHFEDTSYAPRHIASKVIERYKPVPGDYFVVYEDGYESISPKKTFEEGYSEI